MIPFYGQAADARDTAAALRDVWQGREGAGTNLLLAGVGWIPIVGDGAKGALRAGRRVMRERAEEAAERVVREGIQISDPLFARGVGTGQMNPERFQNVRQAFERQGGISIKAKKLKSISDTEMQKLQLLMPELSF